jgi:hypothetical protein
MLHTSSIQLPLLPDTSVPFLRDHLALAVLPLLQQLLLPLSLLPLPLPLVLPLPADCNVVASWGRGEDGQLGHGDAEQCVRPKAISTLVDADVSSICCGAEYTVAVSNKHKRVYSWGW